MSRKSRVVAVALGLWVGACGGSSGGDDGAGGAPDTDGAFSRSDGAAEDATTPGGDGPAGDATSPPDARATDGDVEPETDAGGPSPDAGGPSPDAATGCPPSAAAPVPGLAFTTEGPAQAQRAGETWAWLGLPFAAPPVGDLRWQPPAAPACRDAVLVADRFAPPCPQLDRDGNPEGEEDCLYLNVWRPAADGPARPVLFFVHGGGNAQGSTSEEPFADVRLYDGAALAERTGAVVVTTAYRIGYLGFLAHPWAGDGNFGILDQIAALRWVRDNAAALGADPERVLLFGESAGGRDTCALLAAPSAGGLFSAALIQSGGCTLPTRARVEQESAELVEATACPDAACLRARAPAELLAARPLRIDVAGVSSQIQPFPDGAVIAESPLAAITAGRHHRVPVVVGANADETAQSIPAMVTEASYAQFVRGLFAGLAGAVLDRFPADAFGDPRETLIRLTTDVKFVCHSRAVARALAAHGPTWRYFFTHRLQNVRRDAYAFHGLELFFVFDKLASRVYRPTDAETALADRMGRAWGALAAAGAPGADWPAYDAATDRTWVLDGAGDHVQEGVRTAECDFWDDLLPAPGE